MLTLVCAMVALRLIKPTLTVGYAGNYFSFKQHIYCPGAVALSPYIHPHSGCSSNVLFSFMINLFSVFVETSFTPKTINILVYF